MTLDRKGASAFSTGHVCPSCETATKVRHREFSAQAWAFLIENGEIAEESVGEAICESCYKDMREFLIESISEVEVVQVSEELLQKISAANIREKTKAAVI